MGGRLNAQTGRLISAMAVGQYQEIKREEWDVATYERVAILTVGRQFALNFRLASAVAKHDPAPFLMFCDALGVVVQIGWDKRTEDQRMLTLDAQKLDDLYAARSSELLLGLDALDEKVGQVLVGLWPFVR